VAKKASKRSTLREDVQTGPARLVVLEGEGAGRKIQLDGDVIVIGRAEDCSARFDDPQLSRRHAEIHRRSDSEYELRDLGSSNGTFINGAPIDRAPLQAEDKLRFGANLVVLFTHYDAVEDQLLQRQRLEALGRMGAGVAHDFNNMVGAISSNLEYLESLPDDQALGDAAIKECITDLKTAASRAAELSMRLLDFARGRAADGATIDVGAVIGEVAQLAGSTFERSVRIDTAVEGEPIVMGSSMELHQVLMNLCLNARDAMPGGGTLTIHAQLLGDTADNEPARVAISVSDTGSGMSKSTLDRVFEPFFTTKRMGAGFGLGLALVHEIVTLLGGDISAESTRGRGTHFSIELPLAGASSRKESTADPKEELKYVPPKQHLSILLVDDEEVVRRGARRVLTRSGHRVVEASGGGEALVLYPELSPDVVVLDLDMPAMSGEETLEALLELDPDVRVLMVSGHRSTTREQALQARGAQGFLHKPWKLAALIEALEKAVRDKGASGIDDEPDSSPPKTMEPSRQTDPGQPPPEDL